MLTKLLKSFSKTKTLNASTHYRDDSWQDKHISLEQACSKIPNGSHIFIGSGSATAHATLSAIVEYGTQLVDINILQFAPVGNLPHLDKQTSQFRTTSFFALLNVAEKVRQGVADYIPISTAKLNRMFKEKHIPLNVALVKLTPPNEEGWCSLGVGVDLTIDAIQYADIVIAEICEYMPWTYGDTLVHVNDINWWTESHHPLPTDTDLFSQAFTPSIQPDVLDKLAKNVLIEIPDGATLKFDVSMFTSNLVPYFKHKKNLGLYTDLLNEQLLELIKLGVINNTEKSIDNGVSVVGHAIGSRELLEYVHKNPNIKFSSSYQINRLDKIAQQDNLIYLLGGLKVDLSGQVAVDSLGSRLYGGVGSADDSIRGAGYAKGGKPIVVLPSLSVKSNSNIVLSLPEGTGVAITRLDVHYVITEYGTAFLFGKSIRERCLALIEVAHPEHRATLMQQAKARGVIHSQQPGLSYQSSYPAQWEQHFSTKSNHPVLVRPIKVVDEDRVRDFFHKLSDHNVYMRYFAKVSSLPQKVLKQYTDIDYGTNMALVALSPPDAAQHQVVGIAQWFIDEHSEEPEIAFQVSDDWHGEGLGYFLFEKLINIGREQGIKRMKADVISTNAPMIAIIEKSGLNYERTLEFGVYTYVLFLTE